MKNIEIKKVFINGFLASALCINMTACDKADVEDEKETTTSLTTSSTSVSTTKKEETSVTEIQKQQPEMTMEDLLILNEKFIEYLEKQSKSIENELGIDIEKQIPYESTLTYLYVLNYDCFSESEKEKIISNGLIKNDRESFVLDFQMIVSYIGYYNGTYSRFSNIIDSVPSRENYISLKDFIFDKKYEETILNIDEAIYQYSGSDSKPLGKHLVKDGILSGYELTDETVTDLVIKQTYDYAVYMQVGSDLGKEDQDKCVSILDNDLEIMLTKMFVNKEKTLVKESKI